MAMEHTQHSMKKNMPLVVGAILLFGVLQAPSVHTRLSETRWYRDIVGLTPFENVVVHRTYVAGDGLILRGEMTKVRCTYDKLIAYATFGFRPNERTTLDLSAEGDFGDRPPSDNSQSWGPWKIEWTESDTPDGYEIYARHVECPNEPVTQVNLFVSGSWENYSISQQ